MNNNFYDSAGNGIWSTVGSSKFMGGWDATYHRLNRLPHAFELDESQFDSSLFAEALWGQRDIRWSFLREEDRTDENLSKLTALYEQIINSVIVLENGELVQKHTGNPSGSSNTIVDNTMILFRLFAYAWIVLCIRAGRSTSYEEFMREVEAALCGDDNTFTVSAACVSWFNPTTIAPVWSEIGVTTKTPCADSRPLSEVQYLSNGFCFHDATGQWIPVPESAKVLSSLMYGSDVDDVRWHYLRACALRMDSWGNPTCRSVISGYLEYLNTKYKDQLVGQVDRPKGAITMVDIRGNWKSDTWIEGLYCGVESNKRVDMCDRTFSFKSFISQTDNSLIETLQCASMTKSKASKMKRKAKRAHLQGKGARLSGMRNPQSTPRKQKIGKKKRNRKSKAGKSGLSRGGNGVSMVSDGVNVGSVWKNTTAEKVTFPIAREKFADLTSTGTAYQVLQQLYLNPGNTKLFPIFSEIAKNYEEYVPHHLKIYYRTEEYMASGSNVSAGLAALGTNFDPDAPNFASMTELENYEHSISGPPFSGIMVHDVLEERRRRGNQRGGAGDLALKNYFVNYAPNTIADDSLTFGKFYDIGNFQCAVNGTQAGVVGELWIEYGFTMIRRLQRPGAPQGGVVHFSSVAPTTANNFAGAVQQAGATLSGVTLGLNTITFGVGIPGNYLLAYSAAGSTSASAPGAWVNSAGASNLALLTSGGVLDSGHQQVSVASTVGFYTFSTSTVTVASTGGLITISAPQTFVGGNAMDLWIFSLPASVLTLVEDEKELRDEVLTMREELSEMREFMRRHRASRRLELEPDSADEDFLDERKEADVSPYKAAAAVRRK